MIFRLILFLLLNFAALALGGLFTGNAVSANWYVGLLKAPWTPPGWVFGAAWTTIMICFSIYLTYLWPAIQNKIFYIRLYALQLVLNVSWNPTFFYYHNVLAALFIIITLTFLIGFFLYFYWKVLKLKSFLIFPYFFWLMIATSLNGYILLYN